jgi:hypothetical protein
MVKSIKILFLSKIFIYMKFIPVLIFFPDRNYPGTAIGRFFYLLCFLCFVPIIITPAQNHVTVSRLEGTIRFDGMPDEEAWSKIVPLQVTTIQPLSGKEPSEKTEILLGYTDNYFWIGGRLYDSEPSLIQGYSKKRDDIGPENDYFGILIDCLNNNENGLFFCTTPTGNRLDNTIFNDARDPVPYNLSWNTYWDVKTSVTDKGWFVEMQIPFSSLRFKANNGKITMGLIVNRWIPRKNEMIVFPAIDPKSGQWAHRRPSLADDIVFHDIKPTKPVYLTPYILTGERITNNLDITGSSYKRLNEFTKEAGIDLKYGITSDLTLDLTVNTDFAQVEDDDQQVNITRFSLFYPEKRVFFQERSDMFDFTFGYKGDNGSVFYSRRIGLYDGHPVRILGGARLTGKIGKFDIGFINMQTAKYSTELPSENFNVLRLKRSIINPYSYAGGIFTSRIGANGNLNYTYGLDTYISAFGDTYIEFKASQTYDSEKDYKRFADNTFMRLNMESRNIKGWSYRAAFDWMGKDYDPAMGFVQRGNNFVFNENLRYGWIPGENSFLYSHKIYYKFAAYCNTRGLLETIITGPGWDFFGKNKSTGETEPEFRREIIRDTFYIDKNTYVPAGAYSFFILKENLGSPATSKLSLKSENLLGQYYDGTVISVKLLPQWSISQSIKLEGQYQFNSISFRVRDQKYVSHVTGIKLTYMFNTKLSAGAFIQYNSAADAFLTNIRIRFNPREGNDFYLVFNEGRNTDIFSGSPQLPRIENQTLQIKYSYTFRL